MRISYNNLKKKMPEITGLMFTFPVLQDERATEIWLKFRNDGVYAYINFEQPLPTRIYLERLVGAGNALNCSDYKKDNELVQYSERDKILSILDRSENHLGNLQNTVRAVKDLFIDFKEIHIHF